MTRLLPLADALLPAGLEVVRAARAQGRAFGIPTDTLYGLAADPLSERGCSAILALKGRPLEKAFPVLLAGLDQLGALGVRADTALLAQLARIWPAPLTVVLPLAAPIAASGGMATLAVRVPAHDLLRSLLRAIGPVTATSANPAGSAPAMNARDVALHFPELDLVLDGGSSSESRPSTLVDLSSTPPRVLREGSFSFPANF